MVNPLGALLFPLRVITAPLHRGSKKDAACGIELDSAANKDYTALAKAAEHLAQEFPTVDERDAKTPDAWVKRHPDLIRLTGKHPFNVEANLPDLMGYGYISPANLHIVRNHGPAPRLSWDDHKIVVKGNVPKPFELSMDQLAAMKSDTFPCLVVCAGNRRKEQNQIKQSIGFNWGPCAVGNTYWTGVPLRDILRRAGITKPGPGARFVCFAGPRKELPRSYPDQQGGEGSYGTSIDMETALDPTSDIIIAYEQNGQRLHPDHGFPCRVLIPGYIGGRMVKWLCEIEVTDKESDNFFHFNDNRVLPPNVDADKATAEGWWFKPEYIINNLNINGAISYPWHGDKIDPRAAAKVDLKGYAYSGGGRKVIRVEISLDSGLNWQLAQLTYGDYHEPRWAAGSSGDKAKYWVWCHWELEVSTKDLAAASEVVFRAWDQAQNTMPERPTWNVMGMLNNPWYRVKVIKGGDGSVTFEHATQAGPDKEQGWMVKAANKAGGHLNWGWGAKSFDI